MVNKSTDELLVYLLRVLDRHFRVTKSGLRSDYYKSLADLKQALDYVKDQIDDKKEG